MHKHGMPHGTFHAISACGPSSRPSRGIDPSEPSPLPICRQSAGSLLSFNLKRLVGPLPRSLVGLPTWPFSSLIFNQLFFNSGPSAIWQNTPFELAFKRITFAGPRVPPVRARPAPPRPIPACAAPARLGLRRPGPARPGPASPDTSTSNPTHFWGGLAPPRLDPACAAPAQPGPALPDTST